LFSRARACPKAAAVCIFFDLSGSGALPATFFVLKTES
jgi:hypothetical protein